MAPAQNDEPANDIHPVTARPAVWAEAVSAEQVGIASPACSLAMKGLSVIPH
jgi:hypothetical protein